MFRINHHGYIRCRRKFPTRTVARGYRVQLNDQYICVISSTFLGDKSSNLTVFAQLPQVISMGMSEVFVMVASFEYAYAAAPRSARSLFMSLRFCFVGISSFINAACIKAFPTPSFILDYSVSVNLG